MRITLSNLETFLEEEISDYDALTLDFIEGVLGKKESQIFIELFDIELELENGEIPWKTVQILDNFEELCQNTEFMSIVIEYFGE